MSCLNLITYNNLNRYQDKIVHFSSTSQGGVSSGAYASLNLGFFTNDEPQNIIRNRELLCQALGISIHNLHNAHQTHGKNVKVIDEAFVALPEAQRQEAREGFDALVTRLPGQCVTVTTADCVPVLLYDTRGQAVAAIHSGWRGTLQNICKETVSLMQAEYDVQPQHLVAAIGPCISGEKYEVGQDLFQQFAERDFHTEALFTHTTNGKYLFDVRQAVYTQLLTLGIGSIETSTYCTYTDSDLFFSARRLGNDSGRMLSGIYLR